MNLETRPSQSEIENKEHEEEIESPQEVNHPLSPQPKQANGNIESRGNFPSAFCFLEETLQQDISYFVAYFTGKIHGR